MTMQRKCCFLDNRQKCRYNIKKKHETHQELERHSTKSYQIKVERVTNIITLQVKGNPS